MNTNYFETKYYTIVPDYPARENEIYSAQLEKKISATNEDFLFMQKLARIGLSKKNSVESFLEFQFQKTNADKSAFLEHSSILIADTKIRKDLDLSLRTIREAEDWIEKKSKTVSASFPHPIAKSKKKKEILSLEEIILKETEFEIILKFLISKKVINENGAWIERKAKLAAFALLLQEQGIIKKVDSLSMGNIFTTHFKIKMDLQPFRREIPFRAGKEIAKMMKEALLK